MYWDIGLYKGMVPIGFVIIALCILPLGAS